MQMTPGTPWPRKLESVCWKSKDLPQEPSPRQPQQLSVAEANQAAALFDYHTAKLMYNNLRTGLDPQILGQSD